MAARIKSSKPSRIATLGTRGSAFKARPAAPGCSFRSAIKKELKFLVLSEFLYVNRRGKGRKTNEYLKPKCTYILRENFRIEKETGITNTAKRYEKAG